MKGPDHPAIPPAGKQLTGQTLAEILARNSYRQQRLLRAFADACLVIELVHTKGGTHGRLSPERIVLGDFGELYVTGWDADPTLGYVAPEQTHTAGSDARADVYALGAILFEILAGKPLHPRGADGAQVLPGDPRPLRRAPDRDIAPELDALCMKAVAADPAARLATARDIAEGVHRYLDGDRDLSLRQTLARESLETARKAFGDPDDEVASIAIREAGRALALDPKLEGAAELVTRIMLEPPRRTPSALAETIAADRLATVRRMSRTAMWACVAYLLFAPAFLWLGAGQGGDALMLTAIVLVNIALLARQGYTTARPLAVMVALCNAVLIGLIARLWSPFLAAPGLAALTVMVSALSPLYRRKMFVVAMAGLMLAAILVPFAFELVGLIEPTTYSIPNGIAFVPPGMHLKQSGQYLTAVMYVIALVGAAAGLGNSIRGGERSMRERLLRIAWQLRQLVPT